MRVLVTGGNGQLALSLAAIEKRSEAHVIPVGMPPLDVTRQDVVADSIAHLRPAIVANAAAFTDVDAAESNPKLAHAVNAEGAGNVAIACAMARVPIIHISTDYIFDGTKSAAYIEDDVPAPINVYGRSKLDGELRVAAASSKHVILRTAWLYSAFGRNFARTMLQLARERPALRVVADQIGTPTYAPHLAHAILAIAARVLANTGAPLWGTYHAAGTGATSWCGLAEEIIGCSAARGGRAVSIQRIATPDYPTPAKRPMNSRLNCSKLERMFGISLPPWEWGVQACVTHLLPHSSQSAQASSETSPVQ